MAKSKVFKKALENALKKEGVKNEWIEKHLLIDSLDLDKTNKREKNNGKSKWKNPNHF
tara:strand:+ start:994 stop:1167 length:174 start_codon:yes stop_codon:yes gene_type:complete